MTADVLTLVPHETMTALPEAAPLKRVAIIGTAQTWKACPWQDQSLEVWGLNDAYVLGIPRANRWYDLHPVHQMHFRAPEPKVISPASVPHGAYLRPHGHLDWLRTRPMPVFVAQGRPDWPTSRTFPQAVILEFWRAFWPFRIARNGTVTDGPDYEVSTPSWMLMQAVQEGYQEIHIYGIHLATEWEYVEQRPNFEFLIGVARGLGRKVVLPAATPICKASYRYAFEPKADLPVQAAAQEIQRIKQEGATLKQQLSAVPFYARAQRAALVTRIKHLDAALADARQSHARAMLATRG